MLYFILISLLLFVSTLIIKPGIRHLDRGTFGMGIPNFGQLSSTSIFNLVSLYLDLNLFKFKPETFSFNFLAFYKKINKYTYSHRGLIILILPISRSLFVVCSTSTGVVSISIIKVYYNYNDITNYSIALLLYYYYYYYYSLTIVLLLWLY